MDRTGGVYAGWLPGLDGLALVELPGEARLRRRAMAGAVYLVIGEGAPDLQRTLAGAFASGLAVIAPREGACLELVEHGRNGWFYEPRSTRELARRLAWAEAFPERMRQMGECAKADYRARFVADWSYPSLFGERRRAARAAG